MPYKDPVAQRDYQRRWAMARRLEQIADKSCDRCGSTERLEFHHVDRATKADHRVRTWSRPRAQAELAKCVVLCDECHRAIHAVQRREEAVRRAPHGTRRRYELGCHCGLCRRAKARSNRFYLRGGRLSMTVIESWLAVVQRGDEQHEQETELVTLRGIAAVQGADATIELTDGTRITLLEPAAA